MLPYYFFWFQENNLKSNVTVAKKNELLQIKQKDTVYVKKDVLVKRYFKYLDSIVLKYDSLTSYKLNEHLLVRANSWIIDTLQHTDYYRMKARDSFVYDQRKMIV